MRKSIILVLLAFFSFEKVDAQKQQISANDIFSQMKRVADWQWTNLETKGWKNPKKDWTSGAMYTGMMAWAKLANDETYYNKLIQVGVDNKWETGRYRLFADDYCVGQLYSQLYTIYKRPEYIQKFRALADTIVSLPHTEGLEWKNGIYTREWAWCDALFMGPPALGYLTQATGDQRYLDQSIALWWKSTAYLYDKDEHLFYRDSRYFDKKEKNGTKVFWSRGNGWVIAGLARLLSATPENHPEREKLVKLFIGMSEKLASLQQVDGSWHASLLDPESFPVKETSGTGFIAYALTWGINNGLISYKKYEPVVSKAWTALTTSVHADGKLGFVQAQGAAPDKVGYDDTDVYGVGAFLLAGSELLPMYANHKEHIFIKEIYNETPEEIEQTITIKWADLSAKISNLKRAKLILRDVSSGLVIPSKVEYHKKVPQAISFTIKVLPGTKRIFEVSKT